MKNKSLIIIFKIFLCVILFSCEKETIPPFEMIVPINSINCYIATDMMAINHIDNYYSNPNNDTVLYSEYNIYLYFNGKMVSKGIENPKYSNYGELQYFINKIKNFNIKSDKIFKEGESLTNCFIKEDNCGTILTNYQSLGYSPIILSLEMAPDSEKYYTFTIEITDIYDNVFTASTDSIFILKTNKKL
jgi:hypothetical protein